MASYSSGQQVTLSCNFSLSGIPADPTTTKVSVRFGTASASIYTYPTAVSADGALVRGGTGAYSINFIPISAGTYYYRFQGFTGVNAAEEGAFDCATSRF